MQITKAGIRKTARATKLDSKTVMLIARGELVKVHTLAQVAKFLGVTNQHHRAQVKGRAVTVGGRKNAV